MLSTDLFYPTLQTAQELLLEEGKTIAAEALNPDNVEVEWRNHDNWNGGIDFYEIVIHMPVKRYAQIKKGGLIESVTESISDALDAANAGNESTQIMGVSLRPSSTASQKEIPVILDASFWTPGHFKVFISHLSKEKDRAARLKLALNDYGVSCFVAHEDITVSSAWHDEIVKALKTMDCLVAILSEGFNSSAWCDQEVGFGLGRGVLCIPLKNGVDPYGLFGKYQAMNTFRKTMREVADNIFKIISSNEKTKQIYQKTLVDLFLTSSTKEQARKRLDFIDRIPVLLKDVASSIRLHFSECILKNDKEAITSINSILAQCGLEELPTSEEKIMVFSDDLPF